MYNSTSFFTKPKYFYNNKDKNGLYKSDIIYLIIKIY